MVAEVKMPALSPTMEEGKIVSWNKKEGDKVAIGDVILEVETDKAIMEVEAQEKGVIGKIFAEAGQTIKVGEIIALILEKGEDQSVLKNYKLSDKEISQTTNHENSNNNVNANNEVNITEKKCDTNIVHQNQDNRVFASPLAKNIAKINNIDINLVNGSGPNGRIIKEDIEKFLSNNCNQTNKNIIGRNNVEYIDIEPTGMRATVAKRLLESKQEIPHWYLKISVDMSSFVSFRNEINKKAKIINGKPEYKISANDIIVMAIAKTLKNHQRINSIWNNGKIRQYNNVDIAVACAVDDGIFTPVIKNADQLSLFEISSTVKHLVEKAKNGKLSPNEYNGGALTISNLGMYDVEEFTSIINPPQSCIVAVGTIKNAVAPSDNGQIVIKPTCKITFSADHRVIDGQFLALFAKDVKTVLENPALLLI